MPFEILNVCKKKEEDWGFFGQIQIKVPYMQLSPNKPILSWDIFSKMFYQFGSSLLFVFLKICPKQLISYLSLKSVLSPRYEIISDRDIVSCPCEQEMERERESASPGFALLYPDSLTSGCLSAYTCTTTQHLTLLSVQ